MMKNILLVLVVILAASLAIVPVMANEAYSSDVRLQTLLGDERAGTADVEDVKKYVDEKGGGIISILMHLAEPILVAAFIVFAFITVFGLFGNGSLVGKGVLGMVFCGIGYTAIMYSSEILHFISTYFAP